MAKFGEWNSKGATLSDATAHKEYGVSRDLIVDGQYSRVPSSPRLYLAGAYRWRSSTHFSVS